MIPYLLKDKSYTYSSVSAVVNPGRGGLREYETVNLVNVPLIMCGSSPTAPPAHLLRATCPLPQGYFPTKQSYLEEFSNLP